MKRDTSYVLCAEVRYTTAFDEGVVLRQKAGEVLVLNEIGVKVLTLIGEGTNTLHAIADTIDGIYDVDRSTLVTDVADYLDELESAGVIEAVSGQN